jgi:hypothetical protein
MLIVVGNALRPASVTVTAGIATLLGVAPLAAMAFVKRHASTATMMQPTKANNQIARRAVMRTSAAVGRRPTGMCAEAALSTSESFTK